MRKWTCSRLAWFAGATLSLLTVQVARAQPAAASNPASSSSPAAAIAPEAAPLTASGKIDPESLLLFALDLDKLTLTEGLAAYGEPQDPLIPLSELARFLEYDIDVLPAERRIVGRLGQSRTSLVVDLATGTARVGGRTVPLGAQDVAVTPNEIYLRASAINRLLPLELKVNPNELAISVVAKEPIPIQSRLERLARLRSAEGAPGAQEELLRVPSPYGPFSMPNFDVSLSLGAGTRTGAEQGPAFPFRYDVRAAGDLLYGGYQAYVGSDERGGPAVARLTFERRSVEGRLLGPLKARQISIGDVYTPSFALGPRSLNGRGFALSTVPLDQTNVFNRVDLRGELPLGYDVELYVNDVLQGGQNTPNKGRYEFLNVPLTRGVNVVRVVTYGPHGERDENTRIVNVGGAQLARGEMTFEFAAVQQERSLFLLADEEVTDFISDSAGRLRVVAGINYGLTQFITVTGGAALIPAPGGASRGLYGLGARTSLLGFVTQLDLAMDSEGGTAEGIGLAGQVFGVSTVVRYLLFQNGFLDENGPGVDFTRSLVSRGELNLDGNVQFLGRIIPLSFRTARTEYSDGEIGLLGAFRASATTGALLLSGGLEYSHDYGRNRDDTRLTGFFAASTFRSYTWQIRSTIDYDILPEFHLRALAITADRDLSERTSLRLGLGQSLDNLESFNVTASAITRTKFGDFALTTDYSNQDKSWRVAAQVNFGLAFDPVRRRYGVVSEGVGGGGSVAFHAFLDQNGNGERDAGEGGVRNLIITSSGRNFATNEEGRVLITGLGSTATARLTVSLDELDNPSLRSPPVSIQVNPRPGSVTEVAYPMRPTGDVMVRILLRRGDGSLVGLSAVQLQLVGEDGKIVEAKTEFDGAASFEGVVAGKYTVQLNPEQAQRLRMRLLKPLSVVISSEGFNSDASAEVAFEPRPQQSAATATPVQETQ
ncbi:hypothetical protein [Phenylobacterium sp.]|uniref:hypothetical protein n=1 Tax=Phenylobacterium sp. TaxID=1871053 RepID=UPI002F94374A